MHIMILLMAFSLSVSLIFLGAYIWSVRSGQFDDKYTPSVRILFDDKIKSRQPGPDSNSEENNEEMK